MRDPHIALRTYIDATAGVRVEDDSLARVTAACGTAAAALDVAASGSLFDTEPANLESALDQSARGDSA